MRASIFPKSNICSIHVDLKPVLSRATLGEGKLIDLLCNDSSMLAGEKGVCDSSKVADASSNSKTLSPSSCISESIYIFNDLCLIVNLWVKCLSGVSSS